MILYAPKNNKRDCQQNYRNQMMTLRLRMIIRDLLRHSMRRHALCCFGFLLGDLHGKQTPGVKSTTAEAQSRARL